MGLYVSTCGKKGISIVIGAMPVWETEGQAAPCKNHGAWSRQNISCRHRAAITLLFKRYTDWLGMTMTPTQVRIITTDRSTLPDYGATEVGFD